MASPRFQQALAEYQAGRLDKAESILRTAVRHSPGDLEVLALLGTVLGDRGSFEQAEFFVRKAISIAPGAAELWGMLGDLKHQQRDAAGASAAFKRAVEYAPGHARLHRALCAALHDAGMELEAAAAGAEAARLNPRDVWAFNNWAGALCSAGLTLEGLRVCEQGLEHTPNAVPLLQSAAYSLCYLPTEEPMAIARRQIDYGRRVGLAIGVTSPQFQNPPDPDRPLRIGLLSPDLRKHSVAYFIEPWLGHVDRERYAVHAYHTGAFDSVSERLSLHCRSFRRAGGLDDRALAELIRSDGIDVLIDLAGHSAESRVTALLHGAAPVQATYVGYPATTGLPGVQYRIVDAVTDPQEPSSDEACTEQLVRLPRCFLCYAPPPQAPEPSRTTGRPITFVSLNNIQKVTDEALRVWARLLQAVPDSRLVVRAKPLGEKGVADRVWGVLAAAGAEAGRVELTGQTADFRRHLESYSGYDIALDPWPYNGTTTTCETLWMGVPVVTMRGRSHVSRVGQSLLGTVGLGDLVAADAEQYIGTAAALASDAPRRDRLRAELRPTMAASPLCDGASMAAALQDAWRWMWRRWCEGVR